MLSQLKIPSLESQKKEAKQGYLEYLQLYVTSYLGRPMEKVHVSVFFYYSTMKEAKWMLWLNLHWLVFVDLHCCSVMHLGSSWAYVRDMITK